MPDQSQFAIQVAEVLLLFDAKVGDGTDVGLHDKVRYMVNSGRKNVAENLAALPSANLCDTFPVISNWECRIL